MAHISKTHKKLHEAAFFLSHLSNQAKALNLELEYADFYLSAFLSAGHSVIDYCAKESGKRFYAWYREWEQGLPETDRKFLLHMKNQRNAEVHRGDADVRVEIESTPVTQVDAYTSGPLASYIGCDPPGIQPAEVGQRVLYFELAGETLEVIKACNLYLDLLRQLVNDFEQHASAKSSPRLAS